MVLVAIVIVALASLAEDGLNGISGSTDVTYRLDKSG
jgi:hypothetical protein